MLLPAKQPQCPISQLATSQNFITLLGRDLKVTDDLKHMSFRGSSSWSDVVAIRPNFICIL
jgi:hypothetical protein